MKYLDKLTSMLKSTASNAKDAVAGGVSKGKDAAGAVRDERRRKALISELGDLVHGSVASGADITAEQARLVAEIDEIDAESEGDGEETEPAT